MPSSRPFSSLAQPAICALVPVPMTWMARITVLSLNVVAETPVPVGYPHESGGGGTAAAFAGCICSAAGARNAPAATAATPMRVALRKIDRRPLSTEPRVRVPTIEPPGLEPSPVWFDAHSTGSCRLTGISTFPYVDQQVKGGSGASVREHEELHERGGEDRQEQQGEHDRGPASHVASSSVTASPACRRNVSAAEPRASANDRRP